MARLFFRYGAMNSGKTTAMLQAAHNYEERGHAVLIAQPALETKGDLGVMSRLGVSRKADFVVYPESDLYASFERHREEVQRRRGVDIKCFLLDEAQFLSEAQVDDLLRIALLEDIPVLAFGIRTDFQTVAFPGSRRLLEVSHEIEELKTICRCGRKAIFNTRKFRGEFVFDGDQVALDEGDITYESLCGLCYLQESKGFLNAGRRQWPVSYRFEPDPDFS
jgi:thymidine kinase